MNDEFKRKVACIAAEAIRGREALLDSDVGIPCKAVQHLEPLVYPNTARKSELPPPFDRAKFNNAFLRQQKQREYADLLLKQEDISAFLKHLELDIAVYHEQLGDVETQQALKRRGRPRNVALAMFRRALAANFEGCLGVTPTANREGPFARILAECRTQLRSIVTDIVHDSAEAIDSVTPAAPSLNMLLSPEELASYNDREEVLSTDATRLTCDGGGCGAAITVPATGRNTVAALARAKGWKRVRGRDYCPDCEAP